MVGPYTLGFNDLHGGKDYRLVTISNYGKVGFWLGCWKPVGAINAPWFSWQPKHRLGSRWFGHFACQLGFGLGSV